MSRKQRIELAGIEEEKPLVGKIEFEEQNVQPLGGIETKHNLDVRLKNVEALSPVLAQATDKALERIEGLEYEVSGLRNEIQKLTALLAARIEDDKEDEGWENSYRIHVPEIKGSGGLRITTSNRLDDGHIQERSYIIQIRDIEGEEPRLRLLRASGRLLRQNR